MASPCSLKGPAEAASTPGPGPGAAWEVPLPGPAGPRAAGRQAWPRARSAPFSPIGPDATLIGDPRPRAGHTPSPAGAPRPGSAGLAARGPSGRTRAEPDPDPGRLAPAPPAHGPDPAALTCARLPARTPRAPRRFQRLSPARAAAPPSLTATIATPRRARARMRTPGGRGLRRGRAEPQAEARGGGGRNHIPGRGGGRNHRPGGGAERLAAGGASRARCPGTHTATPRAGQRGPWALRGGLLRAHPTVAGIPEPIPLTPDHPPRTPGTP